jgi:gamma-glutamylcyclotransferase
MVSDTGSAIDLQNAAVMTHGHSMLVLVAPPLENTMIYFAYGSNMLTARLLSRCLGAEKIEPAFLTGYTLGFDKRSRDGSGKCTIRHTGGPPDFVHGVLFTIPQSQVCSLARAEGEGTDYDRVAIQAETKNDKTVPADTYIAKEAKIDRQAKPYDWYLDLVVTGAELHGLPKPYIDTLRKVQVIPDPMPQRPERLEALNQLGKPN